MSVNLCAKHWTQPLLSLPHCSSLPSPKVSPRPGGGELNMDSQLTASFCFCSSLQKKDRFFKTILLNIAFFLTILNKEHNFM